MSKIIMDDLYYGRINPFDYKHNQGHSPEYTEIEKELQVESEYFKALMSQEDSKRFDTIESLYSKILAFEQEDCFAIGLCIGIRLMIDVLVTGIAS